jgi:hypothetical protein
MSEKDAEIERLQAALSNCRRLREAEAGEVKRLQVLSAELLTALQEARATIAKIK